MTKSNKRQFNKGTVLVLTLSGSRAYGTHNDDSLMGKISDTDVRGVCFEQLSDFFSGNNGISFTEQNAGWGKEVDSDFPCLIENKDSTVYGLSKWLEMAAKGSPNNLEILWMPRKHYFHISRLGEILVDSKELFISKKVRGSYKGYAISQLNRLKRHREWAQKGELVKPLISDYTTKLAPDSNLLTKSQHGAFIQFFIMLMREAIENRPMNEDFREYMRDLPYDAKAQQNPIPESLFPSVQALTNATDEFMALLHATQRYNSALTEYNDWLHWKKNRNEERALLEQKQGYDGKHAGHLMRLFRTGSEILRTGQLIVDRREAGDVDSLIQLRRGNVPYLDMIAMAEEAIMDLDKAEAESTLPEAPDHKLIQKLKEYLYECHFGIRIRNWVCCPN